MAASGSSPAEYDWESLLRLIPGYDPFESAEDCEFDERAARLALEFFPECLRHVKGEKAGQPFELCTWQQSIIANLFGWKQPDGTRRYREAFIYVPRKAGKSVLCAGICNYVLFCDDEPGAEIYSAAADRDQASLVFAHAKGMVESDERLSRRAKVYAGLGQRSIVYEERGSSYRVISADAPTKHGFNSHLVVIDELHAQPNRDLVEVLQTSTGARRQPLVIYITTADFDRVSVCNEMHDYAGKVRDGIIEDRAFLPVIYEAPRDADWTDPDVWQQANPNLGVSISTEYMERACRKAQETPAFENTFKRLHLNIKTEQDVRWLSLEKWDACGEEFDPVILLGKRCWCGLDLGSTSDLTSLCLLFPGTELDIDDADAYFALWWFWAPRENAEKRERRDRVPYLTWSRQGFLELTDGDETDYRFVRSRVNEIGEQYQVVDLAADRLFQGAEMCQNLADDGFNVVPFGQGFHSMAAPTVEFERRINRGELRHNGNPVVRWMASNASVKMDPAGNMKPDKQKSTERIDGVVAAIMALGRAMVREEKPRSVYETRGILVV